MPKNINVRLMLFSFFTFIITIPQAVFAVYVNGYYRSNGTWVNGYERTSPDGNPYNNYSFPGNYNPNTGEITGGNADTYLNNYYNRSSGSDYSSYYGGYDSGYSSPSYNSYNSSYPTTPTCPLNSYYDGISSCKCNYGYIASGSSCVSANSLCYDQLGYNSSYDSLSNSCKCSYGYVIGSTGKCMSGNSYCSNKLGIMSEYNNSTKQCQCLIGYEFDGFACSYKTTTQNYYPTTYTSVCPINSHVSPTDSTKCLCDLGYEINSTKNACILPLPKGTGYQNVDDKKIYRDIKIKYGYNTELGCNALGLLGEDLAMCKTFAADTNKDGWTTIERPEPKIATAKSLMEENEARRLKEVQLQNEAVQNPAPVVTGTAQTAQETSTEQQIAPPKPTIVEKPTKPNKTETKTQTHKPKDQPEIATSTTAISTTSNKDHTSPGLFKRIWEFIWGN